MAEISAPSLILFIASIVIAAGVAGVLIDTVSGISSALDDRGGDVTTEIRTDIEVISDAESGIYDGGNSSLTLLVKNTGSRTVPADADAVDVIVDSQYQTSVTVTPVDSSDWRPGSVVEVTIGGLTLGSGDHRVKLVVRGDEEVFEFRT